MATINTSRSTHQRLNGQMRIGKPKKPVLSSLEQAQVRKAISALQKAVDATDRNTLLVNLSDVFHTTRNTIQRYR